jgi:hypothetical protein
VEFAMILPPGASPHTFEPTPSQVRALAGYRYAHQVLCLNRRLQCTGPPSEVLTAEALAQLYGPVATLYRHRPPETAR